MIGLDDLLLVGGSDGGAVNLCQALIPGENGRFIKEMMTFLSSSQLF